MEKRRTAVVTGGASGIGRACAEKLTASGHRVAIIDTQHSPSISVLDRAALKLVAESLSDEGLDVLVNAAGVLPEGGPIEEMPFEDMARVVDVNLMGVLNSCQILGPLVLESRGCVVNISSQAAFASIPFSAAYTATKGAVVALTRSLAVEWGWRGVRANAVAPGFVITPMTAQLFQERETAEATRRQVPLRRLLTAEEVAEAVVFLASPAASGITGAVLTVDGGWTAGRASLPWEEGCQGE